MIFHESDIYVNGLIIKKDKSKWNLGIDGKLQFDNINIPLTNGVLYHFDK